MSRVAHLIGLPLRYRQGDLNRTAPVSADLDAWMPRRPRRPQTLETSGTGRLRKKCSLVPLSEHLMFP